MAIDFEPEVQIDFEPEPEVPLETGALDVIGREMFGSIGPLIGGAIGGRIGFAAGGGPLSPPTAIAGTFAGGLAGGLAGDLAQRKIMETVAPEFAERLERYRQAGQEQHPYAAALGRFIAALGAFQFAPGATIQGVKALPSIARGTATEAEKQAAAVAGLQLGVGTAGGAAIPLIAQQRLPTAGELGEAAVQAALLGQPRIPGLRIPAGAPQAPDEAYRVIPPPPEQPTPGAPSAIQPEAAPILRDVREQPIQGQAEVPVQGEGAGANVPRGQETQGAVGEVLLDPRIQLLREEGVTPEDATALIRGEKTVKEVVEGNFKVTPAWVPEPGDRDPRGGHAEAFMEGYKQAIARLREILKAGKEPTVVSEAPPPVTEAPSGESVAKSGAAGSEPTAPEPINVTTEAAITPVPSEPTVTVRSVTALKNAMIEQDRQALGLPPFEEVARQDYREAWDSAMAQVDRDPLAQDKLIAELSKKPRALRNAQESALLHHRMIELKNAHAKATAELALANQEGRSEDAASIQSTVDMLSDQALELTDITKAAGREWGRTGLARQQLVADDFSYIGLELKKRAAVGGRQLTDKEKGDLAKLAADYEKKTQELERQLMEANVGRTIAEGKPTYAPALIRRLEQFAKRMDENAAKASARIKEKLARTSAGVDPTILSDVAVIGAAKITRGVTDFAKWSNEMVGELGEWLRPELQAAWNASNKFLDDEIKAVPPLAKSVGARSKKRQQQVNETRGELNKLESDFQNQLRKDREQRVTPGKAVVRETQRGLSSFRTLKTAYDVSAVLRQGGFITLGHPVRASKAIAPMLKSFASEKAARTLEAEIQNRPNAPLYKRSRLFLAPLDSVQGREEAFLPSWVDELPGIKGSQRAYVSFLNKLRADSFDAMVASLRTGGESVTPQQLDAVANYINVATGRGNLGAMERAAEGLATVFFSPRLVTSRFQLLLGQPFMRGDTATRKRIAQEYARALMGIGVVYALGQLGGGEVENDPRSSDFGKMRFGNTRVDPLMGLSQNTVLMTRLSTGQKKTLSGAVQNLREGRYGQSTAFDVLANFTRSKLAPVPGTAVNILTGKNVVGEPTTPGSVAKDLLVPLSFQDIAAVMREHDVPEATIISLLSALGMSVQNYEQR